MPGSNLSRAAWRKSSYSNGSGGSCVEVATLFPGSTHRDEQISQEPAALADPTASEKHIIAVRDSKDRRGPVLVFGSAEWRDFAALV
jgi:threonine dehydrogenase-like Zn-dependent dehydrogenase